MKANTGARLVLIGYSAGGDAAIDIANAFARRGISTGALVTFDPHLAALPWTHNYKVSGVGEGLNFYQRNPLAWGTNPFRGGRVSCPNCVNVDLTGLPVSHVTIVEYALKNYRNLINGVVNP